MVYFSYVESVLYGPIGYPVLLAIQKLQAAR